MKIYRSLRKNKHFSKPKKYAESSDNIMTILFVICFAVFITQSTAPLPDMLNHFSPILARSEEYGDIFFTLSSGYIIGFSVWYLDVYRPKKSREQFAYRTLFCDYHSVAKCINDLIIKFEAEFEIEGYFIQNSPRTGSTELALKYAKEIHNINPDFIGPLRKHISKGIFISELKRTQLDIELALEKIIIYSNILPMHEVNSVLHLKHYLSKINHLINVSEYELLNEWPNIINLFGECCYRGMVILDKANELGFSNKNIYLAQINETHPSLLKRTQQ